MAASAFVSGSPFCLEAHNVVTQFEPYILKAQWREGLRLMNLARLIAADNHDVCEQFWKLEDPKRVTQYTIWYPGYRCVKRPLSTPMYRPDGNRDVVFIYNLGYMFAFSSHIGFCIWTVPFWSLDTNTPASSLSTLCTLIDGFTSNVYETQDWTEICAQARKRGYAHILRQGKSVKINQVSCDYFYVMDEMKMTPDDWLAYARLIDPSAESATATHVYEKVLKRLENVYLNEDKVPMWKWASQMNFTVPSFGVPCDDSSSDSSSFDDSEDSDTDDELLSTPKGKSVGSGGGGIDTVD